MTKEELRAKVLDANLELVRAGLVLYTWGNASMIDRENGWIAIKPSGVPYAGMKAEDIVITDLEGNVIDGAYRPSSDLKTHVELYKGFPQIGGVVHTHSTFAVAWAQRGHEIPCFGTTHADYFYGPVPVTRSLTKEEIEEDYEKYTGTVILERFKNDGIDPVAVPAVVVKGHGPFTWGKDAADAAFHAAVLEEAAKMAYLTVTMDPDHEPLEQYVLDKHYMRKHGPNAYYGQTKK